VDELTRLALGAREGDENALDRLVEGSYEQVWRLCSKLVDEQCADDLAQDVFLRAVRALPTFRGESSARTWLFTIARNACMDELRARIRLRQRDELLAARLSRGDATAEADQEFVVTDMLARLTPERKEAFVLTQLLGLSYDEAANVCGCPIGTIRSRVARARADLLATLDADERDSTPRGVYRSESNMYPMTRDMTS
jgi:RNA polymerase sigma-70 factor (ECF subfamily)